MISHFTYLLLDLGSLLFPLVLSFDKRVRFCSRWRQLFPAILIGAAVFLVWDEIFTRRGIWHFNPEYITGIYLGHLPLEEVLFFFFIPYACIFIYECLDAYFGKWINRFPQKRSRVLFVFITIAFLFICFRYHDRDYTFITFAGCAVFLTAFMLAFRARYFPLFMATWLVHLIPLFIVNGVLTSLPVVIYNNAENMGIRIGTVPFEDAFYSMLLLLINMLVYLGLKRSAEKRNRMQ